MKNINLRVLLSAVCVMSIFGAAARVEAGPVRYEQVVQILNARPGKAETSTFSRIVVAGQPAAVATDDDDDDKKKKSEPAPQDDRVITEVTTEIVTDEPCDCEPPGVRRGFPKWALLGLAAIPIAFILIKRKKDTPTPTIPTTQTQTPPPTTKTPPPTTTTPTPPTEPVPEPMTILLFGTGLASVGLAARRRFGKKRREDEKDEE